MSTTPYTLILASNEDKLAELYKDRVNKLMYENDLNQRYKYNIEIGNLEGAKECKDELCKLSSETKVKIVDTRKIDMEFFTGSNYKTQYSLYCSIPKNLDHIDDNQLIYRPRVNCCILDLSPWFLTYNQINFDRIKVYIDKPINTDKPDIPGPFVKVDLLSKDRDVGLSTTISKLRTALDKAWFFTMYDYTKIYIDSPKGIVDYFYIDVKYENGICYLKQHV